jgi:hypothetical protein
LRLSRARKRVALAAVALAGVGSLSVITADAAGAAGVTNVTDDSLSFGVKVSIGDNAAACSGALVTPWWFLTSKSCFADANGNVTAGAPPVATTATVGRLDLTTSDGYQVAVDQIVPNPDRDVVAARLVSPAINVPTVPVATAPPAAGAAVTALGYGRTSDTWVPNVLHSGDFTVGTVNAGTLDVTAATDGTVCKGDAGGPLLVSTSSGPQLVGLHSTSWQGGCFGEPDSNTRHEAIETRLDDLGSWITTTTAPPASMQIAVLSNRIGLVGGDFASRSKDGGLSTAWTTLLANAKQIVLAGTRIGILTNDGTAWVKDTSLTGATFIKENVNVTQLALSPKRIAIIDSSGLASVKEGGLSAAWVKEKTNATSIAVTDTRFGEVTSDGVAWVNEGALTTAFTKELTGVTQIALAANRIGCVLTTGEATVKDGGLSAAWTTQAPTGITSIVLDGTRVGVLTSDHLAKVKDGTLTASFVTEDSNVRQLSLGSSRIGIVNFAGVASVKDGGLSALWTKEWP